MVSWFAWQLWRDKRVAMMAAYHFHHHAEVYGIGTSYAVLDPDDCPVAGCRDVHILDCCSGQNHRKGGLRAAGLNAQYVAPRPAIRHGRVVSERFTLASAEKWKEVLIWGWLSIASCVLVVLPWGLAIAQHEPDFWHYFFWVEHIQRFAMADAQHKAPFWYYRHLSYWEVCPGWGCCPVRFVWHGSPVRITARRSTCCAG